MAGETKTYILVEPEDLDICKKAQEVADQCHVVLKEIQKLITSQSKPFTVTITHKSIDDLMPQET